MPAIRTVFMCLAVVPSLAVAQSGSIDLLSFARSDAKIVAGAHVDAAKNSAFGIFVLSHMQSNNPALQKFIHDTGLDPRTDVTEVLVSADGVPGPSVHGVVAAHGKFANAITTLEAAATMNGGTVAHNPGVDVITIAETAANPAGQSMCAALYTDGATAVIGDCGSVQAALASASPTAPTGTSLLKQAQQIRSQQDLWFTSVLALGQSVIGVPSQLSPILNSQLIQAIQQASGGVKFVAASTSQATASVQLSGAAVMDTHQNATSLMNVLNFLLSMIQMQGASEPAAAPFLSLLSNVQTSVTDSTLNVNLTIPEMTLEQLFDQAHQQASVEPSEGRIRP